MKKWMTKVMISVASVSLLSGNLNFVKAQEIEKDEGVVIGFDDTFAPFGFKNDAGEYVGFDIELAKEVLGRMDVAIEFQPIDWSMKETELNTGNIDMIWNGYTITEDREKNVLFSIPYIQNRQVIIVKADSDIQNKSDLAAKIIATQEQSASLEAILSDETFARGIDGGQPVTYPSFVEVFSDLDTGRADAIVVDELMATYYLEQQGSSANYRILEDNFGEEDYAVGFRKSDEAFVNEFNTVLEEVLEDGSYEAIKGNWFKDVE